jgi:hypothetical protein
MASMSDVRRLVTTRVLPALVAMPLVVRLIDAPPTSPDELAVFATATWITVLLRPLVVSAGFVAAVAAVRTRVSRSTARSAVRAAVAIAVIWAVQLVGSMFISAAGAVIGVPIDLATGATAALLVYVPSGRGALASRAAT